MLNLSRGMFTEKQKADRNMLVSLYNTERAGIRTPDNLIKSQVLYRLSYTPFLRISIQKICLGPESNQ